MFYLTLLIIYIYPLYIVSGTIYMPEEAGELYYFLLRYFGMVSYVSMFFQYLWSLKLKVLERFIPYDLRIKKHRILGYITLSSIIIHPILYTLYNIAYKIPFSIDPYITLGSIAYTLTLAVVLTSIFHKKLKLNYEKWKRIHWLSFGIFTFVYFHTMYLGSDMYGYHRIVFKYMWIIYLVIGVYKLIYELLITAKVYRVTGVRYESESVTTIEIPVKGNFYPGQFGFFKFKKGKKWLPWHPFTLSSRVGEDSVTFTIKNLGDFTGEVSALKAGDSVKVDFPYGGFTLKGSENRIILIAGGVGITPFHSILTSLSNSDLNKDITLIYAVNREDELIFKDEFNRLFRDNPQWNLHYVISERDGYVTGEKLSELCRGTLEGTFYLCGPKPMIAPLKVYLKKNRIKKRGIRAEEFLFLP